MDDKLLQLYFEGRTTEDQSREVTVWLNADKENMKHYQQLCRLFEICYWQERPKSEIGTIKQKTKKNVWMEVVKIAAVFILGFGLNYFLNLNKEELVAMQTVHVPAGQNAWLTLADSSKVWLNAGSTLEFPNRFVNGERKVRLEGEGYFEVHANKEKPFIVSTKSYDITALGTAFNVIAYDKSDGFETALMRGKVEITDHETYRTLTLTPNNRAILVNNELRIVPIENENYFLWRKGIIYFDEPMENVLKKLELYFDVDIHVYNTAILKDQRHCTGKFRTRDGLDHILQVLQVTEHFTYKKDDEKNTIIIK